MRTGNLVERHGNSSLNIALEGSIIDRSFVDVAKQRNYREDNADSAYRSAKTE